MARHQGIRTGQGWGTHNLKSLSVVEVCLAGLSGAGHHILKIRIPLPMDTAASSARWLSIFDVLFGT